LKDTPPPAPIQKPSPVVKIKENIIYQPSFLQVEENPRNKDKTLMRNEQHLSEYKSVCNSELTERGEKTNKHKDNKVYSKSFQCDKCNKKYTWYSGLANHKRFVHNNVRVK
jgi:hypothetical protein